MSWTPAAARSGRSTRTGACCPSNAPRAARAGKAMDHRITVMVVIVFGGTVAFTLFSALLYTSQVPAAAVASGPGPGSGAAGDGGGAARAAETRGASPPRRPGARRDRAGQPNA